MDNSLFRTQSLVARQNPGLGQVSIASPLSHAVWVGGSVLVATAIVLWLVLGHYTRREHAVGILVPRAGLVHLVARENGTVSEVLVSEGDSVTPGQPLLRISGEKSSQALGNTGAGVAASLALQDAALKGEVENIDQLARQQAETLAQSQQLLKNQQAQFARQLDIARQQSESYSALLERIRPLVKKGYVSQLQVQQQEAQALDAKAQTEALLRQEVDTERQLEDVRSQLVQLPANSQNKRSELLRQRAQLQQAILENEAGRMATVNATSAGTVSSLLAVAGQSVTAGEPLLAMVPASSPLEAQLLVPSSAIGFIHVGTKVRLHYVAFPYQKFGIQGGSVTQVSKSALTPGEAAAIGGSSSDDRQARYRVRVALDQQTVLAYGKAEKLLPGMSVEADLLLDRRTLLEWLLEPLFGARKRMTEGAP